MKYISGHSDIMMGVVLGNNEDLIALQRWSKNTGNYVSPDDIYMSLRGLRTLPLRLKKSSQNSIEIAKFLETKNIIKKVLHPALEQHPDHELWKRDFKGASGLFAIEFHDNVLEEAIDMIADNCKIFGIGSSWGGYSSLISMMNVSESRNIKTSYIPKGVYLRIYTGSENINDLLNDFKNGIKILRKF